MLTGFQLTQRTGLAWKMPFRPLASSGQRRPCCRDLKGLPVVWTAFLRAFCVVKLEIERSNKTEGNQTLVLDRNSLTIDAGCACLYHPEVEIE